MTEILVKEAKDVNITDIPAFHQLYSSNRGRTRKLYNKEVCAFDIETTCITEIEQSIMYLWQFCIENVVIVGRTWDEFKHFITLLKSVSGGRTIVVFVHNLSYEIQYLSGVFHFENKDIFATDSRKVLRANIDNIEFRCSYRLTNLSLKALTERYNVDHKKLDDFVYDEKRYPWTELNEHDLTYGVNDVVGLVESIKEIMKLNGDDFYSLPLTSTGFVRRECKRAMRSQHLKIMESFPSYDVFRLLRAEFRGGNTHANRYYVDDIIDGPITSMDISSSYPSQQCNKLFPVTPFQKLVYPDCWLIDSLIERGKAVLFEVTLFDVKLRDKYTPIPYIPFAKCVYCLESKKDNGRILSASELCLVVNEIDWKIIIAQYTFSAEVVQGYYAGKGRLPQGLIDCNIEFFKRKTELKGVEGKELFYLKSKELLNGIYGMSVQNPAKTSILFNECAYDLDTSLTEEELLNKARKRAFTLYQYGCWTTAHARDSLQAGIDLCGYDLLYVDTDSCKFIGKHDFSDYNAKQIEAATASGLYATDKKGVVHYGGVYEFDGEYDHFITQGAKKYLYSDKSGLHLTVSGVGKKAGVRALIEAAGSGKTDREIMGLFRDGFIFHNCGKTESIYNDRNYGKYEIDGHTVDITRNIVIKDQDYTMNKTQEFRDVISDCKESIARALTALENFENL